MFFGILFALHGPHEPWQQWRPTCKPTFLLLLLKDGGGMGSQTGAVLPIFDVKIIVACWTTAVPAKRVGGSNERLLRTPLRSQFLLERKTR